MKFIKKIAKAILMVTMIFSGILMLGECDTVSAKLVSFIICGAVCFASYKGLEALGTFNEEA